MQQQSGDQQQQPDDLGKPEEREAKNQPVPAGDLKAAGQQDGNQKPAASAGMADPNVKDGLMTHEEALKMLQSVRDRDMLRRMQQQRQERSRHVPVDRDW
jgi:Ca-activated chloride channel family protein